MKLKKPLPSGKWVSDKGIVRALGNSEKAATFWLGDFDISSGDMQNPAHLAQMVNDANDYMAEHGIPLVFANVKDANDMCKWLVK